MGVSENDMVAEEGVCGCDACGWIVPVDWCPLVYMVYM